MKVLVTGSSGRVGRAIWVRFARQHQVIGLDRSPASTTQIVADVADRGALAAALEGVDAVVHTAALHAPHVDLASDAEFERINVGGTRALFQSCLDAGVRAFVFTSTTALYGDGRGWVTEDTEPAPRTVYHRSKLAAENLLRAAASPALPVTVLRMSRCFPEPAPQMSVYRLHRGIDARDVASAHERALLPGGLPYRVFIVSGATPFEPADATELASDAPAVIERRARLLAQAFAARGWSLPAAIDRVYAPRRAARELGWAPRFGFEEVLRQLDAESSEVLPA